MGLYIQPLGAFMGENANKAAIWSDIMDAEGYTIREIALGNSKIAFFEIVGLPFGLAIFEYHLCFYSKTSGSPALKQPREGGMLSTQWHPNSNITETYRPALLVKQPQLRLPRPLLNSCVVLTWGYFHLQCFYNQSIVNSSLPLSATTIELGDQGMRVILR